MDMQLAKRTCRTLMKSDNKIIKELFNEVMNLEEHPKILIACEWIAHNPNKFVTKKFKSVIVEFKDSNKSLDFLYSNKDKKSYNKNKLPCPNCNNTSIHLEKDYFRCDGCNISFHYVHSENKYVGLMYH